MAVLEVAVREVFQCFGCIISHDCLLYWEISMHNRKATQTFHSLYRVLWCQKSLKSRTKLWLFKAVVLFTLLYYSETWVPLATHIKVPAGLHWGACRWSLE